MKRTLATLIVMFVALAFALPAEAKKAKSSGTKFAQQGKIAVSTSLWGAGGVGFALNTTTTGSDAPGASESEADTTVIYFHPAVDYFVIDGLGVGLEPYYEGTSGDDYANNAYGLGLRVNYYYKLQGSLFL